MRREGMTGHGHLCAATATLESMTPPYALGDATPGRRAICCRARSGRTSHTRCFAQRDVPSSVYRPLPEHWPLHVQRSARQAPCTQQLTGYDVPIWPYTIYVCNLRHSSQARLVRIRVWAPPKIYRTVLSIRRSCVLDLVASSDLSSHLIVI